jgi:cation diffusion facilitator family transporter
MTDTEKYHGNNIMGMAEDSSLKAGYKITWVGMVVNILLMLLKLWIGVISRSQALIADGFHSLSDLFTDFIALFGLKWGRKEPDEDHPFGHARIETITGMLMGLILILVGIGIVVSSVTAIYHHREANISLTAIGVAVISIILKEIMYWYTIGVGRRIQSLVLIGNAWHHRTDALSSVAVLIGLGAAYINPEWHLADTYAALIVSVFIFKVGSSMVWTAFKEVVDTAPDRKVLMQLAEQAEQVEGVHQAHDIRARYSGSQILVEIHIVVNPNLTVREGHTIAKQVEHRLLENIKEVTKVIVHVDPDPKKEN